MTSVDTCRAEEDGQSGIDEKGGRGATYGAPRGVDGEGLGVFEHLAEGDGAVARGQRIAGRRLGQNCQRAIDHGQQFLVDGSRVSGCSFEFNSIKIKWN